MAFCKVRGIPVSVTKELLDDYRAMGILLKDFNEDQPRDADGKWTSEGGGTGGVAASSLLAKNPAKIPVSGGSKLAQENIGISLSYLEKGDIPGDIKITVENKMGQYGQSKGKNLYIDQATAENQHPLFTAGVIKHESIHSIQDYRIMDSSRREFQARWKTSIWAQTRPSGANWEEKAAIQKIIRESSSKTMRK